MTALKTSSTAHHDAERATWPCVHFTDRVGESFRSPPLCHLLWIDPRLEHEFARHIQPAREDKLACFHVRGVGCCGHGSGLSLGLVFWFGDVARRDGNLTRWPAQVVLRPEL